MKVRIVWRTAKGRRAREMPTQLSELPPLDNTQVAWPSGAREDGEAKRAEALECPGCSSLDVRRSRRSGFIDRFQHLVLGKLPYRCRNCKRRFYLSVAMSHFPIAGIPDPRSKSTSS